MASCAIVVDMNLDTSNTNRVPGTDKDSVDMLSKDVVMKHSSEIDQ